MTTTLAELQEETKAEFYSKFTDRADAENGYYDSELIEGRPYRIEGWVISMIEKAYELGISTGKGMACDYLLRNAGNVIENEVGEQIGIKIDLLTLEEART